MRIAITAAIAMVISTTAVAQQLPESPRPKVMDKRFVMVYGALGLTKALDGISTAAALNRGHIEQNPLFGPRPSVNRRVGVNLGYFVGEVALGYGLKRFGQHHKWARALWLIEPSFQAVDHVRMVPRNGGLR